MAGSALVVGGLRRRIDQRAPHRRDVAQRDRAAVRRRDQRLADGVEVAVVARGLDDERARAEVDLAAGADDVLRCARAAAMASVPMPSEASRPVRVST